MGCGKIGAATADHLCLTPHSSLHEVTCSMQRPLQGGNAIQEPLRDYASRKEGWNSSLIAEAEPSKIVGNDQPGFGELLNLLGSPSRGMLPQLKPLGGHRKQPQVGRH